MGVKEIDYTRHFEITGALSFVQSRSFEERLTIIESFKDIGIGTKRIKEIVAHGKYATKDKGSSPEMDKADASSHLN